MNFDLSPEQRALAEAAASFFTASASPADARSAMEAGKPIAPGRTALARTGFAAITVAESAGGGGGTVLDLAVVAEQAGRVLAGPSIVTAARAAVLLADDDERLAGLATGSTAYAVVDGASPVMDATTAEVFLALRGDALVCAPGIVTERTPIDPTRGLADVLLGEPTVLVQDARARWDRAVQVGQVILAAEGLGTASRCLEIGVEYAKTRHAFGRAIGSYQAVKHALVDVYVGVEQLRSLVWWAAWASDEAPDELPLAALAAKGLAAGVVERAAETLIQVHGGIGFTWEHDAHLFWRRSKVDRFLLGDDTDAFDQVARLALTAPAPSP
jgi:alkylation response protein AidB-like acyl-CoA dehydrogenase